MDEAQEWQSGPHPQTQRSYLGHSTPADPTRLEDTSLSKTQRSLSLELKKGERGAEKKRKEMMEFINALNLNILER